MSQDKEKEAYFNDLVCPHCHGQLSRRDATLLCLSCKQVYKIADGIPDFRQKDEYWCNVSREKMHELNRKASESGDWLKTARELIPEYVDAIEPFNRADAQYLWPTNKNSRILDAGSMWGGLTVPVAQHCGEIFAVDKTIETLNFLKIRAEQMGFNNIHVTASNVQELPFPDGFFDLVILNGVLEWVAFDQEIVLEVHWGKRRSDTATYSKNPRQVQVEVLREMQRVLKPGGHLYLAIENSIGYQYLIGTPDDHVNIKYVSFLPRFLANAITKWKRNSEYRMYTYSLPGYRRLLKDGGFGDMEFYGAFPHYILPSEIVPGKLIKHWKKTVLPVGNKAWYIKTAVELFPRGLLKYVSPSFAALARKPGGKESNEARIIQLLRKAGLLSDSVPSDIKVMKIAGRPGNYYAVNYLIYGKNNSKPMYFCKICRDNKYPDILENEANNLKSANKLLEKTELGSSIPQLLYFGTIDGITFLVTQYIEGKTSGFDLRARLSKSNMEKLDESVQAAIRCLVKFQKHTQIKEVEAAPYLLSVIKKQREILNSAGKLTGEVESQIRKLTEEIKTLKDLSLPICAIHGDYEFSNLLFWRGGVNLIDFEHFETNGLPFFDLANLMFDRIIFNYIEFKTGETLSAFIAEYKLVDYFKVWLRLYSDLSGISPQILRLTAPIAVLEQSTKPYPFYRKPTDYPMNTQEILEEFLSFRIEF